MVFMGTHSLGLTLLNFSFFGGFSNTHTHVIQFSRAHSLNKLNDTLGNEKCKLYSQAIAICVYSQNYFAHPEY